MEAILSKTFRILEKNLFKTMHLSKVMEKMCRIDWL